jgi:hypothetical protein
MPKKRVPMPSILRTAALACITWTAVTAVGAQTVNLSFNELAPGGYDSNLSYQGHLFSPSHRLAIVGASQFPLNWSSSWLGLSQSDTLGPSNPGFVGETGFLLFLAREDGRSFDVNEITSLGVGWVMVSSAGGVFQPSMNGKVSLSGPEWTSVQWLQFGAGSGDFRGFDDLVLTAVPEPASALLLLIGGAALLAARRSSLQG